MKVKNCTDSLTIHVSGYRTMGLEERKVELVATVEVFDLLATVGSNEYENEKLYHLVSSENAEKFCPPSLPWTLFISYNLCLHT